MRLPEMSAVSAILPAMILASLLAVPQSAIAEPAAKLTLTVAGIKEAKGALMIAVFDEATYGKGEPVTASAVPVTGLTASTTFDLAPGRYGIQLFHDVDGDGKMGTNPFGMPIEPFGFSNNAPAQFGPATWQAAAFDVPAGASTHSIQLN